MQKVSKAVVVGLILLGLAVLPGSSRAADRQMKFQEYRSNMVQQLNLPPDKVKEFTEIGNKYMKERMDLYAQLHQDMGNLKQVMTGKDEGKLKDAVNAVTTVKDKLWQNYQDWYHEDMKLLNPMQQAQYLIVMDNWWKKVMSGHEGMHQGGKGMPQGAGPGGK